MSLIIPQSRNFDWLGDGTRVVCPCCGCARPATERFRHHFELMQALRDWWGDSIVLTSGFRCPAYNRKVGGATNSEHILRRVPFDKNDNFATDQVASVIHSPRVQRITRVSREKKFDRWFMAHMQLAERAVDLGFTGIGVYRGDPDTDKSPSLHLDLREGGLFTWGSPEAIALKGD